MRGTNNSSKIKTDGYFTRNTGVRRSTGQMKDKKDDQVKIFSPPSLNIKDIGKASHQRSNSSIEDGVQYPTSPSVHSLIKGFQSIIGNGDPKPKVTVTSPPSGYAKTSTKTVTSVSNTKTVKTVSSIDVGPTTTTHNDTNYKTPGYVVESSLPDRSSKRVRSTKRKLSIRSKKSKNVSADESTRYNIIQSLGMSAFEANENRCVEKSYAFFDIQSLFFDILNAASIKTLYEDENTYTKKLSGASAASQHNQNRKRLKSGELDPKTNKILSRAESLVDEGDSKQNHLILSCPYFRNEVAEPEDPAESNTHVSKYGKDISKLISMFNRNRSFENVSTNSSHNSRRFHKSQTSEHDILLEGVPADSEFFTWDEPNVNEKQIFDFEHIDRGAMYYNQFFSNYEHFNLFGIDEKYGPMAISIVRELLPKMAVLGHNNENEKTNKKYQYRIIFRTCELYTLRIAVMENSVPSSSRHGGNRPLPLKDIMEYCFPEVQLSCLRHCAPGPKVPQLLMKLDTQQLSTQYKIGLLYCKASQKTEEAMYNNEHGGSEFLTFCSIIADTVTLKDFTGYRAQLDNKNDSTGQQSLYTIFHGREIMFHVSTKLPYTAHDRQQLLRKRHIGNDIVTVVFQDAGSEPFSPQMMRSHFQHVFIVVRVENPHTEHTKYEIAVTRSRDVPYFGPPVPPDKFDGVPAFREFLLSKLINAENAAHKSEKFTHMARRTRYEYLKDLSTNHVSQQTLEVPSKFGFSFSSKKKEKSHPVVNPEMWLQGGLLWTVKFDFEHDGPGSSAFLSISTKAIVFVEQNNQKILVKIPCKNVLGWRTTSHTLKLFYNSGKMAFFTLVDEDVNELPFVVNRLKAVTPGCETMDLTLRRNVDGQLGFHVYYEGLVAEVEPYGLAWQAGLRKGSRLLEISGHIVGNMSHERMILMLKRPGVVRIVVLPPEADGQPRNYKAVRKLRRYSSMTSVYSMSVPNLTGGYSSSGLSSSKEYIPASSESPGDKKNAQVNSAIVTRRPRSLSVERISIRKASSNSSDESNNLSNKLSVEKSSPVELTSSGESQTLGDTSSRSQERLTTSRSASELPSVNKKDSLSPIPKQKVTSPANGIDIELGEIERALTDTRKSIDAKFFRSLANSSSPFFPHGRTSGLSSTEENNLSDDDDDRPSSSMDERKGSVNYGIASSDFEKELVHANWTVASKYSHLYNNDTPSEDVKDKRSASPPKPPPKTYQSISQRNSAKISQSESVVSKQSGVSNRELKSPPIPPKPKVSFTHEQVCHVEKNNEDLKAPTQSSVSPATQNTSSKNKMPESPVKCTTPIESESNKLTVKSKSSNMVVSSTHSLDDPCTSSDSSSHSLETLPSEKDSDPQKGSLVRTKVRDASDIINERSQQKDTLGKVRLSMKKSNSSGDNSSSDVIKRSSMPSMKTNENEIFYNSARTRRLNTGDKALVSAVGHAAKKKLVSNVANVHDQQKSESQSKGKNVEKAVENMGKYDESLNETFAKLDAAFGFRRHNGNPSPRQTAVVTPQPDERGKKKKINRRRLRNFEPPSSDSSDEVDMDSKRRSRNLRRQNLDDALCNKTQKSEAEESLEAALSDFRISLSDINDDKKNSKEKQTKDPIVDKNSLSTNDTSASTPILHNLACDQSIPVSTTSKSNQNQQPQKLTYVKTIPVNTVQVSNIKRPVSDASSNNNRTIDNSDNPKPRGRSRSEAKISLRRQCTSPTQRPGSKLSNSENIKSGAKLQRAKSSPVNETEVTQIGIETVEDITIVESVILENEIAPS